MKTLLLALLLPLAALAQSSRQGYWDLVTTNYTPATNAVTTNNGPVLRLNGEPVGVGITITTTNNQTNWFFYQVTVDGTNWGPTNAALSFGVISPIDTTQTTNFVLTVDTIGGYSGFRLANTSQVSSNTNATIGITNSYGTWR